MTVWDPFGTGWSVFGSILERLGRASFGSALPFGRVLGAFGNVLGALGGFGAHWGHVGCVLEAFGRVWERFKNVWERFGAS